MTFSSFALQYQKVKPAKVKAAALDLFITEGGPNGSYPALPDAQVARLQAAGSTVVGYVETSIVEDYRTYWDPSWTSNGKVDGRVKNSAPEWLKDQPSNSFGPIVDYTDPAWKKIVIDQAVDLVERGYDGVFLDDVAQYFVRGATGQNERGQALSMLKLVNQVSKAVHEVNPDATIVVNGDPYIVTDATGGPNSAAARQFLKNIDAMLLESHFGINGPWLKNANEQALKHIDKYAQLLAIEYGGTTSQNYSFHHNAAQLDMLSFAARSAAYDSLAAPAAGGTSGHDQLLGTDAPDVFDGSAGRDVLKGFGGPDILLGGGWSDRLVGGAGRDKLAGGQGVDKLTGGGGRDQFVFGRNDGRDRITDFQDDKDTLILSRDLWSGWHSRADVLQEFAHINAKDQAVFRFDDGDVLKLDGVTSLASLRDDMQIV